MAVPYTSDQAILTLDPAGRVAGWSAGAERIKGYRAEEIIGRSFAVFYPPEEVAHGEPARHLAEAAAAGHVEYEGWRVRQDGSRFWADVVLTAVVDERGRLRGYGKVTRDATERKRLEAQRADQVLRDTLTGLGNRALLMERLDHARARLSRRAGMLTLLFLDLDRFKLVNDALGHDAGDELLIQAAGLLREAMRPEDTVVRFGGDEFVVLCEDLADQSNVESVARRVVDALNVPVRLRGREVFLSASIGVVTDGGERTSLDFLRDADAAMYRAKELGGGRYTLVDDTSPAGMDDRLQLSSELHRSLERNELKAWYQPLEDLHTGEVLAFEALVRWQHPVRGLLAPAAFLDVAETVGMIVDLDQWMLRTACMDTAERGRRLDRPVGVWVNLSGRSLADARLPEAVTTALAGSGLDPGLLTLEITEGALMRDAAATVSTLTTLRGLGVQLAIDDFGTGYSSLAYLQRFPVQTLKVDGAFVTGLDRAAHDESAAIVRAIVSLGTALDLRTVAEGIETASQLAAVTGLGCGLGQGFFLGRPAPTVGRS
ncbi:MAG: EAL domain-containing protein [Actinomycetota bacterium]|nr:EAL domain-containing protein [Actinomycetota bacterium]